jgi:Ala-tRNA(Pro) deacylase
MSEAQPGRAALEAEFRRLGIAVRTIEHPPVHTVEDALPHWAALDGAHTKNLFLKDAKGGFWLVSLPAGRRADLKAMAATLGAKKFSVASAGALSEILGVQQGSVSPFALINDTAHRVRFVLDAELERAGTVTFHPLTNTATTAISIEDLARFLDALGHPPQTIELGG